MTAPEDITKVLKNARKELKRLAKSVDVESAHVDADNALCHLLAALGHEDIVALYKAVPKWFA